MVTEVFTQTARTIRVYCPSHKIGFSAAASATIECTGAKHSLARDFPRESFWEYCCDCQHYWPMEAAKGRQGIDECPVCERSIDRRFLCSECMVMSVESNDAAQRKAFFVIANQPVDPVCPGCLRKSHPQILDHLCPDFGSAFVTAREICPFCDQRLERLPDFPCSVAAYVEKLPRSALSVHFEAEQGRLEEKETGKYFLIPVVHVTGLSTVIPKAPKIDTKQDYYNSYYELFNCENPVAGEVMIVSPALVEAVPRGWELREAGLIEIKPEPVSVVSPAQLETTKPCPSCGQSNLTQHAFCKRCGQRLTTAPGQQTVVEFSVPSTGTQQAVPDTENALRSNLFAAQAVPPKGLQPKAIVAGLGAVVLLGILISIVTVLSTRSPSIEDRLDKAIGANQLFAPATENARDLYLELKNSGAREETLQRYRNRLVPLVTEPKLKLIRDFMVPGSDEVSADEWQSAYHSFQFATELRPGDSSILARALYCEGRLAYLVKNEDRAIQVWTRAADVDKTWPLAVNGLGLIFTSRKNYSLARSYYLEAIRRDASWAYPYNNAGTTHYQERNYADAKSYYRKAVELAPQWARPHSWLGDIAMKEQDYNTAIREFSRVLDPAATGTKNMDLDKIRRQLELARAHAEF